jgi:molybdopterin-binding protein
MYISPVLKDRQRFRILEKFEDTKEVIKGVIKEVIKGVIRGVIKGVIKGVIRGVIKSHKSKDIQYNDQNKQDKQ